MTLNLWKGKDIFNRRRIEMNIEQQQIKLCSLCVILTSTIGAESCGKILIQDVINNIGITILFSIVNEKNE